MKYLSVCSGIEAASVAWGPLGWAPAGFAEIEAFPSALLAARYPETPNHGDMTKFREWPDAAIDVLVGGTPCQSFSVAGLRKGLADPRGNLALTYLAIADRYRPEWLVWENVPGVLSSSGGRDFGAFLGGLGQLGYGFAYRVLDAQYVRVDGFGRAVPQRRRRVFVVGHSRDWRRAAAVLFEPESLSGHPSPRREAGEGVAPAASRGFGGGGEDIGRTVTTGEHQRQDWETCTLIAHSLRADGFDASEDGTGRGTPLVPVVARTLTRGAESAGKGGYAGRRQEDDDNLVAFNGRMDPVYGPIPGAIDTDPLTTCVAFDTTQITSKTNRSNPQPGDPCHTLAKGADAPAVAFTCSDQANSFAWERDVYPTLDAQIPNDTSNIQKGIRQGWAVRRLTPIECERLQGFPDGYTAITYRGKPAADGPRYKALGNSMAVNVMRWIGRRIDMVNRLQARQEAA